MSRDSLPSLPSRFVFEASPSPPHPGSPSPATMRGGFRPPRRAPGRLELVGPSSSDARRPSEEPTVAIPPGDYISSRHLELVEPSPSAVADPLVGVVVADRYRIVEVIGRGGMGVVYKVVHQRIGKVLAMKLLAGELARDPDVARRFKREALTVSRLASPNTVQVFDFGVSSDFTYLVMELVQGENLGRSLRTSGPMPQVRLAKIMVQVCNALAEAHDKNIVHRDIKPDNIMILTAPDGADVVKVLDFGLAKLRGPDVAGDADITGHGTIVGTPYYMAPEQIRGDEVDARTDVYAVGALMYRLSTGRHPFSGPPMSVMSKQLTDEPIAPIDCAPDVGITPGMNAIVLRALRKAPADRFQSIEEMRGAIVEEMRAAGSSSVDRLIDPTRLGTLEKRARRAGGAPPDAATRDDVDAYERGLRRRRYGVYITFATALAAAALSASLVQGRRRAFDGAESEPNDAPAQATPIPLGKPVAGHLGRRIDATHGDRDFYAIDVPAPASRGPSVVSLKVTSLPNIAMCTYVYPRGSTEPLARYCVGRPGQDLVIPALALQPGPYLVAVLQDLEPHGGARPFVQENVSDAYTLVVDAVGDADTARAEVEPNDAAATATLITPGAPRAAAIAWSRDEDVFCVAPGVEAPVRLRVHAAPRRAGTLEVTVVSASGDVAPPSPIDPTWLSAVLPPDAPRCVRVRLSDASDGSAPGSDEPYWVEAIPQ